MRTDSDRLSLLLLPADLVVGERLAQDCDQRAVAGEEDAVKLGSLSNVPSGDVEPDQRLAGTGTPVTKQIDFQPLVFDALMI